MKNVQFVKWLVLVGILIFPMFGNAARSGPPNIVFILADDLGWADSTPYGSTFHETPNIQRLADSGENDFQQHTNTTAASGFYKLVEE